MSDFGSSVFGKVSEQEPVTDAISGKVKGRSIGGVAVFRGIPYGGPCDGENRWLPSKPADKWAGVRDCTRNGPLAIQIIKDESRKDSFGERYFSGNRYDIVNTGPRIYDENCLVLNVLTPDLSGAKLPVLIYLHGGGFSSGSGNIVLGADVFVREENIVLVSVNHRLNIFGFLDLSSVDPLYAGSGNTGMLDLVLALEWVRDNIHLFGGDPDKVTIMGESGGAMKVSTLLSMERARGLFHRAIVESGSTPVGTTTPADSAKRARALMEAVGASTVSDLQKIPPKVLYDTAVSTLAAMGKIGFEPDSGPVGDDLIVPANPDKKFLAPEISKHIPLLVGASEDELGIFGVMPEVSWDKMRNVLLDPGEHLKPLTVMTVAGKVRPICSEKTVDAVIKAARAGNHKGETPGHTIMKIISSKHFLSSGAFFQAEAKARQGGSPVYNYFITYDSPNLLGSGEGCAWHTAELPLQLRMVFCPETDELSRKLAACWAAFVRSSDPSARGMKWLPFTPERRETMVIDESWSITSDPGGPLREAWGDELFQL